MYTSCTEPVVKEAMVNNFIIESILRIVFETFEIDIDCPNIHRVINPQRACARGLLTLSVCFFIVEKDPFSGLKLTSIHSRLI